MGLTAAERQRRSRAHKADDHALCDPKRCPDAPGATVTDDVTPAVTRDSGAPRWFRAGGRQLWDELSGDSLSGARRVLLEQACRIVDRLDRLDAILNGRDRAWLTLETGDDGEITVIVDKVLAESRQQSTALKQLFAELRQGESAGGEQDQGGSILDELAAARAKRLADAAGQ